MEAPLQFHPRTPVAAATDHCTADPIVGNRVELQLLTTLKCNLKCSYCSLGVGDVLGSSALSSSSALAPSIASRQGEPCDVIPTCPELVLGVAAGI